MVGSTGGKTHDGHRALEGCYLRGFQGCCCGGAVLAQFAQLALLSPGNACSIPATSSRNASLLLRPLTATVALACCSMSRAKMCRHARQHSLQRSIETAPRAPEMTCGGQVKKREQITAQQGKVCMKEGCCSMPC